jgi:hypothetical protein
LFHPFGGFQQGFIEHLWALAQEIHPWSQRMHEARPRGRTRSFVRQPTIAPSSRRPQKNPGGCVCSRPIVSRQYNAVLKSLIFKGLRRVSAAFSDPGSDFREHAFRGKTPFRGVFPSNPRQKPAPSISAIAKDA